MSERPNEPSGATPRPDDAAIGPPATDSDTAAVPPSSLRSPGRTEGPPFGAKRDEAPVRAARRGGTLGWIAFTVALLAAAGATSPWWAPRLAPLLPWSAQLGAVTSDSGQRRIEERLAALEQRGEPPVGTAPAQAPPEIASLQQALDKVNQQLAGLEQRLSATEQAVAQLRQGAGQSAAGTGNEDLAPLRADIQRQGAEIAKVSDRVAAIEKQLAARPASDPAVLPELQTNLSKIGAALAELDARVAKFTGATETSGLRTDQALLLSLGQLRQTMQGSGPFAAERAAAMALAQERPDIQAALEPLAEPAARGLPSVAVLRQRFEGIAGAIAAGTPPAPANDWSEQILGKLRGLVTVRRVGPGGADGTAETAVATAESALADDDLAGAVAALETLHGPAMLAARDWLDSARRRLAAQAAVDKATGLVTARLAADKQQAAPASAQPTPAQPTPAQPTPAQGTKP
jgi:hypothetical protein